MEEKLKQAYLYDFYGELLNERQRQIYEDFVFNDFSLGEIAGEEGISRQGVADMVKRCDKKLEDYEKKLHLVERFVYIKEEVQRWKCKRKHMKLTKRFADIRQDLPGGCSFRLGEKNQKPPGAANVCKRGSAAPDPRTHMGAAVLSPSYPPTSSRGRAGSLRMVSHVWGHPVARIRASPRRKSVVPFAQAMRRGAPVAHRDPS